MKALRVIASIACMWFATWAHAELAIEITRGYDNPTPIAVVPFAWNGSPLPEDIAAIISANLERSGQFAPVGRDSMLGLPHEQKEVFFRDWRALDAEYLVIGRIHPHETGVLVEYELFDVYNERRLMSGREVGRRDTLRTVAHRISDRIYEQLTGVRGAFNTRLMYIGSQPHPQGGLLYRLMMSDADGARERVIREQRQPLMSPAWAPDGETIAYVSFETSRSAIFMHNLRTNERTQLTNFRGINTSPAWSPDGRKLAMVLSKGGNPDIYVMDIASRELTQVTRHFAIDTEPAWLPDGKSLLFTSDRGGSPQIYQVELGSGNVKRLTYVGDYNARARILPDGRGMIMVNRTEGQFHIALQHFERGTVETLSRTSLDESPSVAPNGTIVIYGAIHNQREVLSAVSVDGGVKFRLPSRAGDVRDPAWSPFPAK